jgi:hypothetical protein
VVTSSGGIGGVSGVVSNIYSYTNW